MRRTTSSTLIQREVTYAIPYSYLAYAEQAMLDSYLWNCNLKNHEEYVGFRCGQQGGAYSKRLTIYSLSALSN
jgi:hypothetical protein